MALHDADIRGDERNSPAVNAHDMQDITQRKAHGTVSTNYTTDATDSTLVAGIKSGILEVARIIEQNVSGPSFTTSSSSWGSGENIVSVPHGLGVVPIVVGSMALLVGGVPSNFITIPDVKPDTSGGIPFFTQWEAYADDINIYFRIRGVAGPNFTFSSFPYFFRVYLLIQKATSALS